MRNWIEFNDIDGDMFVIDSADITHMRSNGKIGIISVDLSEGNIAIRVSLEEFGRVKEQLITSK